MLAAGEEHYGLIFTSAQPCAQQRIDFHMTMQLVRRKSP
jgi:hypothetical protein